MFRGTCAINDGTSVILTGGQYTQSDVFRYDKDGFVENLPSLNISPLRRGIACASYINTDNKRVKISLHEIEQYISF